MIKGILVSLFLLAGVIVLQIVIARLIRPRRVFNLFVLLFSLSVPAYFFLYPREQRSLSVSLGQANGLFIYVLLYFNYVQCFYYLGRPVTLRLLSEFLKAPQGRLMLQSIQETYGLKHMIHSRLDTLILNGYVKKEEARYFLSRKGKIFARLFLLIRQILGIPYYLELRSESRRNSSGGRKRKQGPSK